MGTLAADDKDKSIIIAKATEDESFAASVSAYIHTFSLHGLSPLITLRALATGRV